MKNIFLIFSITLTLTVMQTKAQWSEVGGLNALGANGGVGSIVFDASGNLYVAGDFTNTVGSNYVAKFNGVNWSELGGLNGLSANNSILSVCADSLGNVYAGGAFTNVSGNRYIAKWDGMIWSELGGTNGLSANDVIRTICADQLGNIYAAGNFTNVNGNPYVAKWNGVSWNELSGGNYLNANDYIANIKCDDSGNIYAAGWFRNANSKPFVAKFDGNSWSELGLGANSLNATAAILNISIESQTGNIYCAGAFTNGLGNKYVAKWDGLSWNEVGGINSLASVNTIWSLTSYSVDIVYCGGYLFNTINNTYVAENRNTIWSELGGLNSLAGNGAITSLNHDLVGNIYASGGIKNSLGNYYVAKYTDPNSIIENDNNLTFSAYPNPATDYLHIVLSGNGSCNISIENTLGETVIKKTNVKQSNLQLDVAHLEEGIYFLRIANKKKSITRKFIKSN